MNLIALLSVAISDPESLELRPPHFDTDRIKSVEQLR
ncbi:MAG: hypothetical protein ACI87O_000748 [Planctomycetota bacterium]|jgi:hypothetical protein